MTFKEELQVLSEGYKSDNLDKVKKMLQAAAKLGRREMMLSGRDYDKSVIVWLLSEGLNVAEEFDRNETYLTVSWG